MNLSRTPFGRTPAGEAVDLYTLVNDNGVEARITNFGGIIVALMTPDRAGKLGDIALGFDDFDSYLGPHPFFGALVGRYANRIANGRFTLNGVEYKLPINNGPNALHGGFKGFDKVVWHASGFMFNDGVGIRLNYLSKDGEEGYPGNLNVQVTYTLRSDNALQIDYAASTDKDTVLNLTNHNYFNLSGAPTVYDHMLEVNADLYMSADATLIPNGPLTPIAGTVFDFGAPTRMGAHINDAHPQLAAGRGYDVGFQVRGEMGQLRLAARVSEPGAGRVLECFTTEPDVHFYAGGFMEPLKGKGGATYGKHGGFCLETQHWPDSPNQPQLPSTTLRAGETFSSTTVFKFGVA